jgi:hypothetical protein
VVAERVRPFDASHVRVMRRQVFNPSRERVKAITVLFGAFISPSAQMVA